MHFLIEAARHSPPIGNFGVLIEVQPISTAQGVQLVGTVAVFGQIGRNGLL
jgi:hypothetical protein